MDVLDVTMAGTSSGNSLGYENIKMEWVMKKMGEMSNKLVCKSDPINLIRRVIREEWDIYKREMQELIESKLKENKNYGIREERL